MAERESKSKHLQTVAGVKPVEYWLSTWLWDIANYQIPMWITIILLFAFDVETFTTTEFDIVYGVPLKKDVKLNVGYSFLIATETMKELRNRDGSFNSWGWMMLTVKPTFFESKQ